MMTLIFTEGSQDGMRRGVLGVEVLRRPSSRLTIMRRRRRRRRRLTEVDSVKDTLVYPARVDVAKSLKAAAVFAVTCQPLALVDVTASSGLNVVNTPAAAAAGPAAASTTVMARMELAEKAGAEVGAPRRDIVVTIECCEES